jgi:hypothetical protein
MYPSLKPSKRSMRRKATVPNPDTSASLHLRIVELGSALMGCVGRGTGGFERHDGSRGAPRIEMMYGLEGWWWIGVWK